MGARVILVTSGIQSIGAAQAMGCVPLFLVDRASSAMAATANVRGAARCGGVEAAAPVPRRASAAEPCARGPRGGATTRQSLGARHEAAAVRVSGAGDAVLGRKMACACAGGGGGAYCGRRSAFMVARPAPLRCVCICICI